MKLLRALVPVIYLVSTSLNGSPLKEELVSSDAQWLIHLDAQRFKESKFGEYVMNEFIVENLPEAGPFNLNLQEAVRLLEGITLYGESFDIENAPESFDGIALIQAHPDLRAMLEAVLFMATSQNENPPFTVIQEEPYKLVDVGGELQVAFFGDRLLALGKQASAIEAFAALQAGKVPDLRANGTFKKFALSEGTVTVLAAAEGFHELAQLPQAQILRMANGFLVRLDEKADQLTLDATLTTTDDATARQVSQVLQGILAMAALANIEDVQLNQLLRSAHTEAKASTVNLGLSFPLADIITLLNTLKPVTIEGTDLSGGGQLSVSRLKSSVDKRHLPGNVIDGDRSTYWASPGKGQWIELQFAEPIQLETLELIWLKGNERQESFTVQAQIKPGTWAELYAGNSGADLRNLNDPDFEFVPINVVKTSAVRITGNGNTVNDWNSLTEVRVNKGTVVPSRIISIADRRNLPGNLLDKDKDTSWDTMGQPVWLEGSLGQESVIREIGIVWTADGTASLQFSVSSDSLEWKPALIVTKPVSAGELTRYNIVDSEARYFRLSSLENGPWIVPAELVLYGEAVNAQ